MSYLVLARKARPQRFAEVIGQKAVVRTLENALLQNRVAHAIIFSGVRGTGKTTLARIMAKALNCTDRQGAEPCNQCLSCVEINAGASVDLQEVDGASNRGIQEIRELKERIRFQPSSSRYKIFIIDEVHMLTTEAFNALLKTLEEPPEHVYFMFATTELHKVPLTILSRCQRYGLKRLGRSELHQHFAALAEQEGVQISKEALAMVAREAAGSVRDGLSLLDQLFSYCGADVSEEDVLDVLGLVSRHAVAELGTALLQADLARALELLGALHAQGVDSRRLGNDLLQWLRELLLCKLGPKTAAMLTLPEEELRTMQELAAPYTKDQLSALFNLFMDALQEKSFSLQPGFTMEMACIRAVQVADITPTAELIKRFSALLDDAPLGGDQAAARTSTHVPLQNPAQITSQPPAPSQKKNQPLPAPAPDTDHYPVITLPEDRELPPLPESPQTQPPEPTTDSSASVSLQGEQTTQPEPPAVKPAARTPVSQPQPKPAAAIPNPSDTVPAGQNSNISIQLRVQRDWDSFTRHVQDQLKWMGLALQRAISVQVEGGNLSVLFHDASDCIMLKQQEHLRRLTELALDFFQEPLQVRIEEELSLSCDINPLTGRTPLEERKALASDPIVLTALEVFNGQLGDIRIGARFRETAVETDTEDMAALPQEDDD
ncbi:MAG: DNA polymerase III subunit gamma/tau [Desulfobulbaceae bacterium]|nr:DNA polymerase III subunit gamma/tau [Desulfobulbaceae bacterium]